VETGDDEVDVAVVTVLVVVDKVVVPLDELVDVVALVEVEVVLTDEVEVVEVALVVVVPPAAPGRHCE
jgi:hypothetical protein